MPVRILDDSTARSEAHEAYQNESTDSRINGEVDRHWFDSWRKLLCTATLQSPMAFWTFPASFASTTLVCVVYIYGWKFSNAHRFKVSPVWMYVATCLVHMAWLALYGQTATAYWLRVFAEVLQSYYYMMPIFQPQDRVRSRISRRK